MQVVGIQSGDSVTMIDHGAQVPMRCLPTKAGATLPSEVMLAEFRKQMPKTAKHWLPCREPSGPPRTPGTGDFALMWVLATEPSQS